LSKTGPVFWLALALILVVAPPAAARDASVEEVRALADQAVDDPDALEELRSIDSVDGRPFDIGLLLDDAQGAELDTRLRTLAGDGPHEDVDVSSARGTAEEILGGRNYRDERTPRPLQGLVERLRDLLRPVGQWIEGWAQHLPGGSLTLWVVLAALFLIGVAILTARAASRRRLMVTRTHRDRPDEEMVSIGDLEKQADDAERSGNLALALRLRFLAGLQHLDDAGLIRFNPSLTSGEISSRLRSRAFDALAATHDRVVYGKQAPSPVDISSARTWWRAVLTERNAA
jgi:hypothetical protein